MALNFCWQCSSRSTQLSSHSSISTTLFAVLLNMVALTYKWTVRDQTARIPTYVRRHLLHDALLCLYFINSICMNTHAIEILSYLILHLRFCICFNSGLSKIYVIQYIQCLCVCPVDVMMRRRNRGLNARLCLKTFFSVAHHNSWA